MARNCQPWSAILAPRVYGIPFTWRLVLSRNGVSFSTIGVLRNLDWWNLVRGLIGLKDRSKRSLYWLVCVSALYKHLGNLCIGLASRACPCCSAINEHDLQYICGLLIIPSIVPKVSTMCPFAPIPTVSRLSFHKFTVSFFVKEFLINHLTLSVEAVLFG